MIWNIGLIWIDANVSLASPFGTVPASWFNSIDSFSSIVDRAAAGRVVGVAGAARPRAERPRQDRHRVGSDRRLCVVPRRRFAVRRALTARFGVMWPILCFVGMGIAFIWYWPVLLALVSRAAPPKINSTMMGASLPDAVRRQRLIGWVGSFYDQMSAAAFWLLTPRSASPAAFSCCCSAGR